MSSRRSKKAPAVTCPECAKPILVLPVNGRYLACDPEVQKFIHGSPCTMTLGYLRHRCAKPKVARVKKNKADAPQPEAVSR